MLLLPCCVGVCAGIFRGITVAVKELSLTSMQESMLPTFWDEIRLLSCLHHPHVCLFVGFSMKPRLRVVMEYCENGTLGEAAAKMDVATKVRTQLRFPPLLLYNCTGAHVHASRAMTRRTTLCSP